MSKQMIQAIDHAIGAHGRWKTRLRIALATGEGDLDPAMVRRDDVCVLGRWLHGPEIPPDVRAGADYLAVLAVHAEFHRHAGAVLDLLAQGKRREAGDVMLGAFAECSERLIAMLTWWKRAVRPAGPAGRTQELEITR